jgi:hypothetical protein
MALLENIDPVILINGSEGEGGGQILRIALASSLITQVPIRIVEIRGNRPVPGLSRQHLEVVRACVQLGGTVDEEYDVGTETITFRPTGADLSDLSELHINVNSAGSTTLILQAIVPVLSLRGKQSIDIYLRGGTNVTFSPSIDFFDLVLSKYLERMGLSIATTVVNRGFYPVGMSSTSVPVHVRVTPFLLLHGLSIQETSDFGPIVSNIVTNSSMSPGVFHDTSRNIFESRPDLISCSTIEPIFFHVPEYRKTRLLVFSSDNTRYPTHPDGVILNTNTHTQFKKNDPKLNRYGPFQATVEPILEAISFLDVSTTEVSYVDSHSANQLLIFGFMAYSTSGETTKYRFNLRTMEQIVSGTPDLHFTTALDILTKFFPKVPHKFIQMSAEIGEITIGSLAE